MLDILYSDNITSIKNVNFGKRLVFITEKKTTTDRRVRRTKRQLKKAFIELLYEKNIENISVTDIVEQADYNRSTFYFHYNYKEELINELNKSLLDGLISSFFTTEKRKNKISPSDITIFDYILSKKEYFTLWQNPKVLLEIKEDFLDQLLSLFSQELYISDYKTTYLAHGILGIILLWIKNDLKEAPDEMASLVSNLINFLA